MDHTKASPSFDLLAVFDAIPAVSDDEQSQDSFPTIAWDFDDEEEETSPQTSVVVELPPKKRSRTSLV